MNFHCARIGLIFLLAGCRAEQPVTSENVSKTKRIAVEDTATRHEALFRLAGNDPRLPSRLGIEIGPADLRKGVLARFADTNPPPTFLWGTLDVFSFAARIQFLEEMRAKAKGDERLFELVSSELGRTRVESRLACYGARLIRQQAALLGVPDEEQDLRLSNRVGDFEDLVSENGLDSLESRALERALMDLERAIGEKFPKTRIAITSLHLALAKSASKPLLGSRVRELEEILRHLASPSEAPHVSQLHKLPSFRNRAYESAKKILAATPGTDSQDLERQAKQLLEQVVPCKLAPSDLALAGPERAFLCNVAQIKDPRLRAIVIHDIAVLAVWALALAEDRSLGERVTSRASLLSMSEPDSWLPAVATEPERFVIPALVLMSRPGR